MPISFKEGATVECPLLAPQSPFDANLKDHPRRHSLAIVIASRRSATVRAAYEVSGRLSIPADFVVRGLSLLMRLSSPRGDQQKTQKNGRSSEICEIDETR